MRSSVLVHGSAGIRPASLSLMTHFMSRARSVCSLKTSFSQYNTNSFTINFLGIRLCDKYIFEFSYTPFSQFLFLIPWQPFVLFCFFLSKRFLGLKVIKQMKIKFSGILKPVEKGKEREIERSANALPVGSLLPSAGQSLYLGHVTSLHSQWILMLGQLALPILLLLQSITGLFPELEETSSLQKQIHCILNILKLATQNCIKIRHGFIVYTFSILILYINRWKMEHCNFVFAYWWGHNCNL